MKDYTVGDRITCDQIAPCGECRFCKSGKYWMCQPHRMYGYFKDYCGGMAEYGAHPDPARADFPGAGGAAIGERGADRALWLRQTRSGPG